MTEPIAEQVPAFDAAPYLDGLGAVLAGTANVIMQLSRAPVGYGVVESRVETGQLTRHPLKRTRTTFTYLAVAMLGSADDQAIYRRAVNRSHTLVRSLPTSPVAYSAFDPELQLWVAACLYYGMVDVHARLHGPLDDATADALYAHGARFGTTLQVRPEQWPPDRAAFDDYWAASLKHVHIDEPVRAYLHEVMTQSFLPQPLPRLFGRFSTFVTTGFLPPLFRAQMQLEWSTTDQRRFDRLIGVLGFVQRRLPARARALPFPLLLSDMHRRARRERVIV